MLIIIGLQNSHQGQMLVFCFTVETLQFTHNEPMSCALLWIQHGGLDEYEHDHEHEWDMMGNNGLKAPTAVFLFSGSLSRLDSVGQAPFLSRSGGAPLLLAVVLGKSTAVAGSSPLLFRRSTGRMLGGVVPAAAGRLWSRPRPRPRSWGARG